MTQIKMGKRPEWTFLKRRQTMDNRYMKMYLASFVIEKWKGRLTSYLLEWLLPKSKREVLLRTWKKGSLAYYWHQNSWLALQNAMQICQVVHLFHSGFTLKENELIYERHCAQCSPCEVTETTDMCISR